VLRLSSTAACSYFLAAAVAFALTIGAPTPAIAGKSQPYVKLHRGAKPKTVLNDLWGKLLTKAKRTKRPVVVMFSADWCAPCKAIKEFMHSSTAVRKALKKGTFTIIDVDEFRGPAHQLIPGVNPTKLPTIVRVDYSGRKVVQCYGSDLGLLSEDAIATNLKRLFAGKAPGKPFYHGKSKLESELMRKQSEAQNKQTKGVPEVEIQVRSAASGIYTLNIVLRNHDGPRRWYLLPSSIGTALSGKPKVTGWSEIKWDEHVRATYRQFHGKPGFVAVQVAGYGSLTLNRWTVYGDPKAKSVQVWKLNRLVFDGEVAEFTRKLPYHLKLHKASKSKVLARGAGGLIEIDVAKRFDVALTR
jgi:thiol-disulfide isomerase/thioredoxin